MTDVAPGDFVILNWRAVCGTCRSCRRGEPRYCFATLNATQKMTLADGTARRPPSGIGAFAEKTLVAAGQCTKVDPAASPARPRAARLRRDGRPRRGDVHRRGAARRQRGRVRVRRRRRRRHRRRPLAGATHDHRRRPRRPQARVGQGVRRHPHRERRRTATRSRPSRRSPTATAPTCASRPSATRRCCEQAFFARDLAGTVVQVGVPTPDMTFPDIPMIEFFGRGGALKPSWYGDCLPSRDFPMLIDLYLQGRLDLDRLRVSETIALDGVEEAFHRMERGEVLRSRRGVLMACRAGRRPTASSPSTAASSRSTTTSGWSATTARCSSSTPPTTPSRSSTPSTAAGWWRSRSPTATTTTSTPRVALQDLVDAPILLHPDDLMLWEVVYPAPRPDRRLVAGDGADRRWRVDSA